MIFRRNIRVNETLAIDKKMSQISPGYNRWMNAQSAEKKFWKMEYWAKHSDKRLKRKVYSEILNQGFGLDFRFFANKDVLEIGCGPSGIIYSISEAKRRIGLEPMDMTQLLAQEQSKLDVVQKGVGENIPFDNGTFDVVISFNVLDHCLAPSLVMAECHRVLRLGGYLLLWVHALKNKYGLFQSLLDKIDPPHPYHFTTRQIIQIAGEHFALDRTRKTKGVGQPAHGNLKIVIGNLMTENVWLVCMKRASLAKEEIKGHPGGSELGNYGYGLT